MNKLVFKNLEKRSKYSAWRVFSVVAIKEILLLNESAFNCDDLKPKIPKAFGIGK